MYDEEELRPKEKSAERKDRSSDQRAFLRQRLQQKKHNRTQVPGIVRTARDGPMPMSFAQQRIWFLQELAPGNSFYNIPAAVPLNGQIDVDALEKALNTIVLRHESLRTVYQRIDGQPCQIVRPHVHRPLEITDLSTGGLAAAEKALDDISASEAALPFDLSTGPLMRFRLIRVSRARHVLLLTVHHVAADGWSMGVLFRELTELYAAGQEGRAATVAKLNIQYGDFAQWQRDRLSGTALEELLGYWRHKLDGAQDLPLITDRPRPPAATFRGDFLDVDFDKQTTDAARRLAREHGCTLFQTLLAAFKSVLARYAGVGDVVVGAPIANRAHSDLEPLIGFFVNSLALRSDLSGDPAFSEILARVRDTTLEAYAHQDLPFERLVEELRPDRDLSRNPLFQVSFQIQNAPGVSERPVTGGQDFRRVERSSAILDLAFSLWETPDGLIGGMEYSTDLFDRETVARIAEAVRLVVVAAAADPELTLSHLPVCDAQFSRRAVSRLTGKSTNQPFESMHAWFCETAAEHSGLTALQDEVGEMTFAQLDLQSDQVATAFQQAGISQGDIVGLALPRNRSFVICMLAALKLGAAYLPVDPAVPPGRLKAMADAASPRIMITADEGPAYEHGASGRVGDLLEFASACEPLAALPAVGPEEICYVLFTSGSTGVPKAVEVSHGALANHMQWMQEAFSAHSGDRVLQRTPAQFDASIWEFWLPLTTGATLCLPPEFHAADASALQKAMEDMQPTIVQCVPSLLTHMLANEDLSRAGAAVRILCCGGEPLTAQLSHSLRAAFGDAQIINLYGPTEATIDVTWHAVSPDEQDPLPIGRPVHNCTVLVVDENGLICPPGMRGEIAVSGAPLANGYLGRDDLTEASFVTLSQTGQRAFLTGDMGWYDNAGVLRCSGRRDRQIKLRGNRIELSEIEAVLSGHELVEQAAVVLHTERDQPALAAFVTLRDDPRCETLRRGTEAKAVADWESLYEVVYADGDDVPQDAVNDFTGWNSSFDGQPIPTAQMRLWADETAERIAALEPQGVFEIGCGSGLILSRLAGNCVRYVGCDLSAPVIGRLSAWVAQNDPGNVDLYVAAADQTDGIGLQGCDTIVMNSVVQYLPGAQHLRDVLESNASRLPENAKLFIGDVRPLGLLRAFHTAAELERASDSATVDDLRKRIEAACSQEKELLFDPEFFYRLGAGEIQGDVAVRLKNASDENELFAYRYDVSIRRGDAADPARLKWLNWRRRETSLAGIRQAIANRACPIAVHGIPNARVARDVALSHLIREADPSATRRELLAEAEQASRDAVFPGALVQLAKEQGLTTELLPGRGHPDCFDLVVHDGTLAGSIDAARPGRGNTSLTLSTEPTLRALTAHLAPELRAWLEERLPPVMCPARVAVLDRMPTLTSGKLDYLSLTRNMPHEPVRETVFEAPSDALEQVIADVFAQVLGITQVGREDDFFAALGGHSLLATQAVARLREFFGDALPLRLLFENPSPETLAACIADQIPDARSIAGQYQATKDLDDAALDALLAQPESLSDE
ncbi:non-ribosomal peptide synthetase [uncultured Roseobacter sp.]|uniref:non-ribosomal peptide synthetase n=1 Tax=uncultured Roseobacter sp. TaxID=114847 RepID=UPI002603F030|nr:non-ribosomal peptide synthetase [uncultured Roseobacter sp.]